MFKQQSEQANLYNMLKFKWNNGNWHLVVIVKRVFWMIRPPVEPVKRSVNHLPFAITEYNPHSTHFILTWGVPQNECLCSILQVPSSQPQKERSRISAIIATCPNIFLVISLRLKCCLYTNLKILLYAHGVEALWDDNYSPLHIKPQGHLGCGLVILFSNRYQQLILQQWGTF